MCMGIPFITTNTSCVGMQGVSLSNTCSLDVHGYPFHHHQHQQCGRAGWIPFQYLQFRRAWVSLSPPPTPAIWTCRVYHLPLPAVQSCVGIPFTTTNTSSIDLQGVSLSTNCSLDGQWVSLWPTWAVWMFMVYPFPPPAVWRCRVYPFPLPAVCMCRVYLFLPPAVLMCRESLSTVQVVYAGCVCNPFHLWKVNLLMTVSGQSVLEWTKKLILEPIRHPGGDPVWYRNAPVPDWDTGCRNANSGGIGVDVDAQLWKQHIPHELFSSDILYPFIHYNPSYIFS